MLARRGPIPDCGMPPRLGEAAAQSVGQHVLQPWPDMPQGQRAAGTMTLHLASACPVQQACRRHLGCHTLFVCVSATWLHLALVSKQHVHCLHSLCLVHLIARRRAVTDALHLVLHASGSSKQASTQHASRRAAQNSAVHRTLLAQVQRPSAIKRSQLCASAAQPGAPAQPSHSCRYLTLPAAPDTCPLPCSLPLWVRTSASASPACSPW